LTTLYAEATLDCVQTARALVAAGSRKRSPAASKRGDRRHAHRQRRKNTQPSLKCVRGAG
jgi:hypothetical protein